MEDYFNIVTLDKIDEVVNESYWLIDDIIPQNSMVILYGQSASGKTFIGLDMCLHLVHSDKWKGKNINIKGIVVYCIGEGIKGVCNRIKNWHDYQNKKGNSPFILIPIETISFVEKENIDKMIRTLDNIVKKYNLPISMIVVDTLSKASVGYDENSSKDMGEFLYQFDILKKYYDTSILFIHHSGKSYRGIRGSSYLTGTVDTIISIVNNNNIITCNIEKQKDGFLGKFNLQLCKYDFVNDWEAQQMGFGLGQTLPPVFADFMIAHVAAEVAQNTEFNIWRGDTTAATNNSFDGFEKLIAASAAAGDIPAAQQVAAVGGGGLSAANIIAELSKVVDAIPASLYGKEDLFLYIGSAAAKFYVQALGGFASQGLGANGVNAQGTQWWNNGSLTVNGVKVFVCPGMAVNKMYAAQRSNLYFGCGLLNDTNAVKVLDMSDLDASNNVRMVMRFTSAVQFGIASDIVEYA